MQIGGVKLNNPFILAPMAGFSVPALRRLMSENGAGLTVTEMISCKGLLYGNKKTAGLLATAQSETVKCVQLFGGDPSDFARAALLPALQKFDIIDVNMGCPVKKIAGNGEGSALISDIPRAAAIVTAIKNTGKTVTVKTRLGLTDTLPALPFARAIEDAGADMVTLHARTREQMYGGEADYEAVAAVKAALKIPVALSGDIIDFAALERAKQTDADFFMIGRGALRDPDIFNRFTGREPTGKRELVSKLLDYLAADEGAIWAVKIFRKFLPYILKGEHCGKERRHTLNFVTDLPVLKNELLKELV
ncbi:MAG: tRNA-dihydrouridine synthase family protein [Firmicutes bacterium]|nr:tRNA-dihydrouridine synthase family protein [Bacillota bacterium]